jgi:hypothetical protein
MVVCQLDFAGPSAGYKAKQERNTSHNKMLEYGYSNGVSRTMALHSMDVGYFGNFAAGTRWPYYALQ